MIQKESYGHFAVLDCKDDLRVCFCDDTGDSESIADLLTSLGIDLEDTKGKTFRISLIEEIAP